MVKKELLLIIYYFLISSANTFATEFVVFEEDGKQGLKNEKNEIVVPAKFEKIGWSDSDFKLQGETFGYKNAGLWGLMNLNNKLLTEAIYKELKLNKSGPYIIAEKSLNNGTFSRFGLIDRNGDQLLPFNFIRLEIHRDKIVAWKKEFGELPFVGMLNYKGEIVIPFEYQSISPLGSLRYLARTKEGKHILFDDLGKSVSEFLVDSVGTFEKGFARFWVQHQAGLIDMQGKIVVKPRYSEINIGEGGSFKGKIFPVWTEFDLKKDSTRQFQFDKIIPVAPGKYHVVANQKHWLIDENGQSLMNRGVDFIDNFEEDLAIFREGDKYGIINVNGNRLIKTNKRMIKRQGGFFISQNIQGKWDIIDRFGVQKNIHSYDSVGAYERVYFPVKKGGFWGMMNRAGEEVIFCVYDSLSKIQGDLISVKFRGLFGIIDLTGNWVVVPNPYPKTLVNDLVYLENRNGQTHLMDFEGNLIYFTSNKLEIHEDYILEHLSNDMVWRISFSGVIEADRLSNVISNNRSSYSEFQAIYPPSEGFSAIKKDGKFGFIDSQNRLRIANRYDSALNYSEGLAPVMLRGKWGFIDKEERIEIQPIYDQAEPFVNGLSIVKFEGKFNVITIDNNLKFKSGFDEMAIMAPNLYMVRKGEHYGVVDKAGKVLINYVYERLDPVKDGNYIISKLGSKGLIDSQGLYLIPRDYEEVVYSSITSTYLVKKSHDWKIID